MHSAFLVDPDDASPAQPEAEDRGESAAAVQTAVLDLIMCNALCTCHLDKIGEVPAVAAPDLPKADPAALGWIR